MKRFYSERLKKQVQQVNKTRARNLYEKGVKIWFQTCKMSFDNKWSGPYWLQKDEPDAEGETFDQICNSLVYYNCNAQMGRYLHYFIEC